MILISLPHIPFFFQVASLAALFLEVAETTCSLSIFACVCEGVRVGESGRGEEEGGEEEGGEEEGGRGGGRERGVEKGKGRRGRRQ